MAPAQTLPNASTVLKPYRRVMSGEIELNKRKRTRMWEVMRLREEGTQTLTRCAHLPWLKHMHYSPMQHKARHPIAAQNENLSSNQ